MGFFFAQVKKAKIKAVKKQRPANATKQNAEILNRLGCSACRLNKADVWSPKLQPTLAKDTHVYFLGASPDVVEDKEGTPLANSTLGDMMRSCIPKGMTKYSSFDYVVRDYTPPSQPATWHEMECCRQYVTKSIEQARPRLIVGLGKLPQQWALASSDSDGMRGRLFAIKVGSHACWFMPVYDPQFVYEKAYKKDKPLQSKWGHALRLDIEKAFALATSLPQATVDTFEQAKQGITCIRPRDGINALMALLAKAKKAPLKDVDIETTAIRPYKENARILSVAVSFGDTNFSFVYDHPRDPWKPDEFEQIGDALFSILKDDTIKVAHNAPFECEWFIKDQGIAVINHAAWECSMMQAHFIDERRGNQGKSDDSRPNPYQSLDFLCRQHFGIPIKKLFNLKMDDLVNADIDTLLLYGGVDSKYGLKVYLHQQLLLKKAGLLDAYYEALPRQATVALMQHIGIHIDQDELKKAQASLQEDIDGMVDEINSLKVVQAYTKDHKVFNPLGGPDVLNLLRDYLKRKEIYVTDKLGNEKESTDKNVLDRIDHPLANLVVQLRNRTKLKSTYIDGFELGKGGVIFPDGKIHTSFNTTFTETGRTSSDEPNQQNWPKRNDSWVRRIVVPPKGHVLLAFDYGQLEACTSAMCSKDRVLVKALWEDYDIHMEWTHKLVDVYPYWLGSGESIKDRATARKYRSVVKNKLVFPAIFGASDKSIAGYLKIPEEKVAILMDEFWDSFSDLRDWQNRLMKGYYKDGWVATPTGRRHHYPLTRNQAINFPIQGVASDIVCDSMNRLSQIALETSEMHLHPVLNIHDDLTFIVPDSDAVIEAAIRRIYTVMLTPPYDFINVPLSVECSIGNNWYEMTEIGKYWSHKDVETN
jgi:uracil-DNA glycosylase family 4